MEHCVILPWSTPTHSQWSNASYCRRARQLTVNGWQQCRHNSSTLLMLQLLLLMAAVQASTHLCCWCCSCCYWWQQCSQAGHWCCAVYWRWFPAVRCSAVAASRTLTCRMHHCRRRSCPCGPPPSRPQPGWPPGTSSSACMRCAGWGQGRCPPGEDWWSGGRQQAAGQLPLSAAVDSSGHCLEKANCKIKECITEDGETEASYEDYTPATNLSSILLKIVFWAITDDWINKRMSLQHNLVVPNIYRLKIWHLF